MLSDFSTEEALETVRQIQWKHIFIIATCLMGLHFVLSAETGSDLSQAAAAAAAPPPKTSPKPPPTVQVTDAENPHVETTSSFLTSQPADSNIDRPFDSVPIAEHIAVCMAVKDQAVDMIEFFVHHYHNMGIRRFYVMDDGSDPPLSTFQYPGIPRSALTFTYQPRKERIRYMQLRFYGQCVERFRDRHTWMAFLDGDEFLETPGTENLVEVLKTFEKNETVGALGVNWRMHTSSGLIARPESTRKSFTTCIYDDLEHEGNNSANSHIKSIVKMSKAGPVMNPHKFETLNDSYTVGEYGDVIESGAWRRPITRTRIGLHHYVVKSRMEFEAKMMRGNGMTDPKSEAFWNEIEYGNPRVNCSEMVAYEP